MKYSKEGLTKYIYSEMSKCIEKVRYIKSESDRW